MSVVSVGTVAKLGEDLRTHKPKTAIVLATPAQLELISPFIKRQFNFVAIRTEHPFGKSNEPDSATVMEFLEAATANAFQPCHIACVEGNNVSMAAAYVLLCLFAKIGQEPNAAIYLRFEAPHAVINEQFVAIADHLVERGGTMIDGLKEMLPARDPGKLVKVKFDLNLIAHCMAS